MQEGLRSSNTSKLCNKHQISNTQYYKRLDEFLENGPKAFGVSAGKEKEQPRNKVKKLNLIIGTLTVELKKTTTNLSYKKEIRVSYDKKQRGH